MLRVGQIIYGYCGGLWGNEGLVHQERRVEAIGVDWVVVRDDGGTPDFFAGNPDELLQYTGRDQ